MYLHTEEQKLTEYDMGEIMKKLENMAKTSIRT